MSRSAVETGYEGRRWVVLATVAVLLWRATALLWPSSLVSIPDSLRLPITLLGVLFLVCGAAAWRLRPGRFTVVLLLYGVGGGIHWGGTIGAAHAGIELSLLFVYLGFSALAEAAFLHLALIFPSGGSVARVVRVALYAPPAVAWLVAAIAGMVPQATLQIIGGLVLLIANLFSVLAAVVFVVRLVRADRAVRCAAHLPLVVATMWTAGVIAELGSRGLLFGQPQAWNLLLGAIPISLAIALVSHASDSPLAASTTRQQGASGASSALRFSLLQVVALPALLTSCGGPATPPADFTGETLTALYVTDVRKSTTFYESLGFEHQYYYDYQEDSYELSWDRPYSPEYAELLSAGRRLALTTSDDAEPVYGGGVRHYFMVDDVERHFARATANGLVPEPNEVEIRPWLHFFTISDPDGHQIVIAQKNEPYYEDVRRRLREKRPE